MVSAAGLARLSFQQDQYEQHINENGNVNSEPKTYWLTEKLELSRSQVLRVLDVKLFQKTVQR